MEGTRWNGGGKKGADGFEVTESAKVQDQADGQVSEWEAMSLDSLSMEMSLDPMTDLSFPLAKCWPAFVKASTQAVSVFDFSELTGVLSLNESLGSSERLLEEGLSTFVPGALHQVEIPKQTVLKEVFCRLNLKIHDMSLVIESAEIFSAYMDVDIPCCDLDGVKKRQNFYGLGSHTKYGAIESVCGVVLTEFQMMYGVIVMDFTYPRVKVLEDKFARELQWSSMMRDALEKEKKKNEAAEIRYQGLKIEALHVCKEFCDILPISVSSHSAHFVESSGVKVVYNGQRPAVSRLEQLAFALVNLVNNPVGI